MRITLLTAVTSLSLLTVRSAIFEFDLYGPPGGIPALAAVNVVVAPGDPPIHSGAVGYEFPAGSGIYLEDYVLQIHGQIFSSHTGSVTFQPLAVELRGPAAISQNSPNVLGTLPFLDAGGGTFYFDATLTLTISDADNLKAGLLYLQVNTVGYPTGELRAQLIQVPEPQNIAFLTCLGLFGFVAVRNLSKMRL